MTRKEKNMRIFMMTILLGVSSAALGQNLGSSEEKRAENQPSKDDNSDSEQPSLPMPAAALPAALALAVLALRKKAF